MSGMDLRRLGELYYDNEVKPEALNAWPSVHENYYKKIQPRDAWVLERAVQRLESTDER